MVEKSQLEVERVDWRWNRVRSVGPEFEDLAESGGGTGVNEERTFISAEVFPVSAAQCGQTVDRNKALGALPPGDTPETNSWHKVSSGGPAEERMEHPYL